MLAGLTSQSSMIPTPSSESQYAVSQPPSPMIGSSRVCEESQELLEIDDEEFNQEKTVVEETDLEDGDVDVDNMEVVQRNKWTKMYSKQKAKGVQHPSYKYLVTIRKKEDREKLDAKPCHDCEKWFASGAGGIHTDRREHLRGMCRHKHLHLPPDSDPRVWDISFPNTEECERIMAPK
eukprot:Em0003g444a